MLEIERNEEASHLFASLEAYGETIGYIDILRQLMGRDRRYLRLLSSGKSPSGKDYCEQDHQVFRRLLDSYRDHAVDLEAFVNRYASLHSEQIADHVWKETEYWYGGAFSCWK